jgi:hypothetical protein
MSNALESCPDLKNRPAIIDIHHWLSAVQNVLIDEYKPVNPAVFLQAIRGLHTINSLNPNTNKEEMKSLLVFLSQVNLPTISSEALGNKNFIKAIKKVYATNQEILEHLKSAPHKYKAAKEASKTYLNSCFKELHSFYSNPTQNESQRAHLIDSIKKAEEGYLTVLAVDRSSFSKLARYLLMAVTNFIASLTLGVAHYINYKTTGTTTFFSGTHSESKLRSFHKHFADDLKDESENTLAAG